MWSRAVISPIELWRLKLEPIDETRRRSEREFMTAYVAAAPGILGALLDGMVRGVRELPRVNLKSRPRLADFAEWAAACEGAFWEPGTFMAAYESNRQDLNEIALDADLVGTAIQVLMATRIEWTGKPAELLKSLNPIADESAARSKEWPVNANQLGRALRRCAPLLRRAGISVHFGAGGKRTIILRRLTECERNSSPSSPTQSATGEKPNDFNKSGHGDTKSEEGDGRHPVKREQHPGRRRPAVTH